MMRRDPHPLAQVKPVSAETLHAAVQFQRVAALLSGLGNGPVEEQATVPLAAVGRIGHEIVDIHV